MLPSITVTTVATAITVPPSSRRFGGGGGGSSLVFSEFETEEDNAYNCEGGGVGEGGESPVGPVTNEVWNY